MATEKTPNYTTEQTLTLVNAYKGARDDAERAAVVATYAEKFSKSDKSVIQKLSREGVYIKKTATTKNGKPIIKREALADKIGSLCGLTEPDTASLSSVNKAALLAISTALEAFQTMRQAALEAQASGDESEGEETTPEAFQL